MVRTYGLTHIALAVQDAERDLSFYHAVFGMVAVYRQAGLIQAQTPGSRDVLVFDEHAPRAGQGGGIVHFGFRLVHPADIDQAVQAVERAGGSVLRRGEFCPGEPDVFFHGLNGYEVEIWYELPALIDPQGQPKDIA
jgi:catechol 2,3-dioxygenase-like lactoylglutathione lyase family enzyme